MILNNDRDSLAKKITTITDSSFEKIALEVFKYQAAQNELYAEYLHLIQKSPESIKSISEIPFLPIEFFKQRIIKSGQWDTHQIFSSSGTTGSITSQHHLKDPDWYKAISKLCFEYFYGPVSDYCVLALLPSYLERSGSSLVFMADYFIKESKHSHSGFFLNDLQVLAEKIKICQDEGIPTILLGVSFALWDFAEQFPMDLGNTIIMETGGMKGRRKEITRSELHKILTKAFNVEKIHSEYGMTELLSQAYSKGDGIFKPGPTMKVLTREITDPFSIQQPGKTGVINIIDLGNLDTISFIATADLGKVYENESFEILGRLDASDVRGCNLMVI